MALVRLDIFLKAPESKPTTFPTHTPLSRFSQKAPIDIYTPCPSKTNHWGWNGGFWWRKEGSILPFLWLGQLYQGCYFFPKPQPPGKTHLFSASDTQDRLLILTASVHTRLPGLVQCLQVSTAQHWFAGSLMAWLPRTLDCRSVPVSAWHLLPAVCPRLTASLLHRHEIHCQQAMASMPKKTPPHNTAWMILIPLHKDSDCRRKVFQFCLTYICKTLAIGTSLSIAWVCQICCPPPRTVCVCSAFSGLSFTGSYSNMAVGMLLQQGFLLTALRLSSIRKPAEYTSGLWLRWLPPCRAISMLYLKWFTDTPSLKLIQRETLLSPWSWFPCMCMDLEEHIMLYSPSCYIHLVFQLFALHIYLLYLFLSTVFCRT